VFHLNEPRLEQGTTDIRARDGVDFTASVIQTSMGWYWSFWGEADYRGPFPTRQSAIQDAENA
jgi:hypothetical protein